MASISGSMFSKVVNKSKRKKLVNDGIFEIDSDDCESPTPDVNQEPSICEENSNSTSTNTQSSDSLNKNSAFNSSISDLLKEIDTLKEEITYLKSKKCTCQTKSESTQSLVRIIFQNSDIAEKCKVKLPSVIEELCNFEFKLKVLLSDLEVQINVDTDLNSKSESDDNVNSTTNDNSEIVEESVTSFPQIEQSDNLNATISASVHSSTNNLESKDDTSRSEDEDTFSNSYHKYEDNLTTLDKIPIKITQDNLSQLISVDTVPDEQISYDRLNYPRYRVKLEQSGKPTKDNSYRAECFNCSGAHSLRDCPKPKNWTKIQQARQNFANKSISTGRYHCDEDEKYGHLKPGRISKELRRALGLKSNELPPYIYKMRVLGYPPGWWQEAWDEAKSVLNIITDKDANDTDKTITEKMIHEFPGFNMPMEKGFKDEYKKYNVPPYQESQGKKSYLQFIEEQKKFKASLCNTPIQTAAIGTLNAEVADMEVEPLDDLEDDINPSLIDNQISDFLKPASVEALRDIIDTEEIDKNNTSVDDTLRPPGVESSDDTDVEIIGVSYLSKENNNSRIICSTPKLSSNSNVEKTATKRSISPSLENASSASKRLKTTPDEYKSVTDNNDTTDPIVLSDNSQSNSDCLILTNDCDPSSSDSDDLSSDDLSQDEITSTPNNVNGKKKKRFTKFITPKSLSKKAEEKLTPVLTRLSTFNDLPTSDCFAKEMAPMLYFENLPDAVGKYDQMRNVLHNVRGKLKQIQTNKNMS